jgi:hypothetical protein
MRQPDPDPDADPGDTLEIEDTDGLVDKKKKEIIINSRQNVDEVENEVILGIAREDINDAGIIQMWHHSIRQFLRNIEPLLRNPDIEGARETYTRTQLGTVTLDPPPFATPEPEHLKDPKQAQREDKYDPSITLHRDCTVPKPVSKDIRGLRRVIEENQIIHEWTVQIDPRLSEGYDDYTRPVETTLTASQHYPQGILNTAVRTADHFLETANVGLSLTDTGGDEADADYSDIEDIDTL